MKYYWHFYITNDWVSAIKDNMWDIIFLGFHLDWSHRSFTILGFSFVWEKAVFEKVRKK